MNALEVKILTDKKDSVIPSFYFFKLVILIFILLVTVLWAISTGSTEVGFYQVLDFIFHRASVSEETAFIIYELRIARVVLGVLAGMSLSLSGMILQAIFRNPLVDPFVIGVSGGASLGAGIAILFGFNLSFIGINSVPIAAFISSILTMMFSYRLSLVNKRIYIDRLLLGGIAISSLTSSILSFLLVIKGQDANAVIFWIMGSLAGKGWESVKIISPYMIMVNLIIIFYLHRLNIIQLGDDAAENLGINTEKIKLLLIVISSLLAASIVSVSGIIGFIGLIVPHIAKMFIKSTDFRFLYPVILLIGAIILVVADTASRTVLASQEIPVGIFTAILGVPFFLFLLKNTGKLQN